ALLGPLIAASLSHAGRIQLVRDINTVPSGACGAPSSFTESGGYTYFTLSDCIQGNELWRSDGTTAGTVEVSDINPGEANSYPASLVDVGGVVYFAATDGCSDRELWRSDGTDAGTWRVKDIAPASSSAPSNLTNIGGTIYFSANEGTSGSELWKSDGSAAGTSRVTTIGLGAWNFVNVNGTLFFTVDD